MADKVQKQQQQPKVLRIGIVQGGKVVHERLIKPGQSVTIGESPKNTFVFSAPGLPKRFTVFQVKGSQYQLAFTDEMQGKVAAKDGLVSLAKVREQRGNSATIALSEQSRGKIAIGDVTVLFQFVAAPPESARKIATQDFRPKLLDEDDPIFLGFLALWSAMAVVLMIYVYTTDPMESVPMDKIPDRFVQIVRPSEDVDPPEEITPEVDPNAKSESDRLKREEAAKKEAEEAKKNEPKKKGPQTDEEKSIDAAAQRERKRQDALKKSKLLAGLIGTRGENNSGQTVADVFADDDGGIQSLEDALRNVDGAGVASDTNVGMRGQTDGGGRGDAKVGDLKRGGGGDAEVGSVKAAAPKKVKTSVGKPELASGEGADGIRSTLKKYSGQVKSCYERRLKENPNVAGRVAVDVDIASGRVTNVSVAENTTGDKALESCITSAIRRWRFDASVTDSVYLPFSLNAS
jgi:outer membrane biosynthesis protein TonB